VGERLASGARGGASELRLSICGSEHRSVLMASTGSQFSSGEATKLDTPAGELMGLTADDSGQWA
jgi:hypothetical protein